MKPLIMKILVIIIAIAIIVPAVYFAYEYYNKSNVSQSIQPFEYIPGNSTMIATVHSNGTEYYVFMDSNSIGIVANISAMSIIGSNGISSSTHIVHTNTDNKNTYSGTNVKTLTYDHITVYEIKNVNLTGLLGNFLNINAGTNLLNKSVNIFVYDASGNFVVLGEENAINDSISIHLTSRDAVSYKSYFDPEANVSLYYRTGNRIPSIDYITLNSTSNRTYINILPENHTDLIHDKLVIQKALYSNIFNNITESLYNITISKNIIHVEVYRGTGNVSRIIKILNTKTL